MTRLETTPKRRVRSTADSLLIHDMKNIWFRLNLLLSNLDEHYGDPEFKRSVVEHLGATLAKIESIVGRSAAHQDSILIKVSLDLNDLVLQVSRRRTPPRSGNGGEHLDVELTLGDIPHVWGDPYYLEDALASIFHNAFEAAAMAGSRVGVRTFTQRRKAVIEIADDGPGMTEEFVRDRLFQPFQTTKTAGVGLGLYTARQIILFHRGELDIRSRPGEGTTVQVRLPAARAEAQ
ncbi:MAG TPA: ATP-binding protein [Thermoanaerobaculia bacterium]|nr:ATP-binding protein [Thermoanaerobaculia bacterium]